MLVTGNTSPRTRRRTDPVVGHRCRPMARGPPGLLDRPTNVIKAAPFRPPPRDDFFSIEESRPSGEVPQVSPRRSVSGSRQSADPMQEYFPRAWADAGGSCPTSPRELRRGVTSSSSHHQTSARCESVPPLPPAKAEAEDEDEAPFDNSHDSETAARSATAPPNLDLSSPSLPDLAELRVRVDDVATAVVEEGQQTYRVERRANISSAMGSRQHGAAAESQLCGTPRRRRLLGQEQAYLAMRYRERPCPRTESFLDEALYGRVSNLSRECCDVLGPRACHQCDRLNRRSNAALRNEASFPSLHISAANFSTLTLVHRVRPELSARQVLERLARGDFSRQSVRRKNSTDERPGDSADEDDLPPARKTSASAFKVPDGLGYFTNFTDLRAQIFARRQETKRGGRTDRLKRAAASTSSANNLPAITDVQLVPKREWERENSANYFGPPMLSRAEIKRQRSQPRFYAGAQGKYQLPEAPSIDEIASKASGARQQQLRLRDEMQQRSDTPESEASTWSLRSTPKGERAPTPGEATTESPPPGQTEPGPARRAEDQGAERAGTRDGNLMDADGTESRTYITELDMDVNISKDDS